MKIGGYEVEGKIGEDEYEKVVKEFGASLIDRKLAEKIGHPLVPGFFFAHRDLDQIIEGKFAIVSGRGPSMHMHLGHLLVFKFVKFLQDKFGAFVFIPFSDDEKLLTRNLKFEDVIRMDYENLLDIIAIGFEPENTEIILDLVNMKQSIYNLAVKISGRITASTVRSALGLSPEHNIGAHFYPAMQAAHILYPTSEYGMRVLVPIGLDQDVFVKLTRDVAPKVGLEKPGDILSKFLPGLTGGKMSSSKPETAIYTTDSPEEVKVKIMNAFTGGQATVEEQRKKGGRPEICPVYHYHAIFFGKREIYEKCRSGELICGDCKKELIAEINRMLREHQKRREKAREKVEKFVPGITRYL